MLPQGNTDCLSGFSLSKWEDILGENCMISGRPSTRVTVKLGTLCTRPFFPQAHTLKPGLLPAAFGKPDNANSRTLQDHVATRTGWFKLTVRQCSNSWHLKSCLWSFTIINSLICPLWGCTVSVKEITLFTAVYMTSFPTSDTKNLVTAVLPADQKLWSRCISCEWEYCDVTKEQK